MTKATYESGLRKLRESLEAENARVAPWIIGGILLILFLQYVVLDNL